MVCLTTGMTIQELLGWSPGVTHRQMLMLIAWEEEQWNIPNRTDHYLMMLACIQARANSKTPQSIQPKDFALSFSKKSTTISKDDAEKQLAYAKASRAAMLGGMKRLTIIDREGNIIKAPELPPRGSAGGMHPMLITKAEHAKRIRTGNTSYPPNSGRESTQVSSTGGRTFTPKHRKGRQRTEQKGVGGDTGDRSVSGNDRVIIIRAKQHNGSGVQGD